MNQTEFAAFHNVSRKTVTKWKERGWVVLSGDDVDVEVSNEKLKKYRVKRVTQSVTQPKGNKQGNKGNKPPEFIEVLAEDDETPKDAAERIIQESGAFMDIDEAKRVKENYLALLNQLDYDIKSRKVVLFDDALKSVGEQYARIRTRLLAIPSEQAPRVHRLASVSEVQDCLLDIITEAMEELTKDGGISK